MSLFHTMDLPASALFDPSDTFDDIFDLANATPDRGQSLKNCDDLVVAWTHAVSNGNSMQNPSVNNPNGNWCGNMPIHVPSPPAPPQQRKSVLFDPLFDDDRAGQMMMNDMQQMTLQGEDFLDDIEPMNWPSNEATDNSEFPWARSPVDSIVQQSNTSNSVGIHYQPIVQPQLIPSPPYGFGSTELAPYMPEIQVVLTSDFEPPSIKKMVKKKQNISSSTPPPDPPRMNEWFLRDESGRRRRPLLHEFIRLLLSNRNYADIAQYVDKRHGIFKFYQRERAAQLWGFVKGRNGSSSKFHLNYQ